MKLYVEITDGLMSGSLVEVDLDGLKLEEYDFDKPVAQSDICKGIALAVVEAQGRMNEAQ